MTHHTAIKHDHRPSHGFQRSWPRPNEIREQAQCIRSHWSDRQCTIRERMAERRLRALAEQLLR